MYQINKCKHSTKSYITMYYFYTFIKPNEIKSKNKMAVG